MFGTIEPMFKFLIVYHPDSLSENKLLFEMARFNFTSFYVRNFEIDIEDIEGLHQMKLSGFRSFDEAFQYARQLFNNKNITAQLSKNTKAIIISDKNLKLIGTAFSYKDYEDFYAKNFAPLQVTTRYLLSEPAEVATPREKERDLQEEIERRNPTETDLNAREQSLEPVDNGMTIPVEEEEKSSEKKVLNPTDVVIPIEDTEKKKDSKTPIDNTGMVIPTGETEKKKEPKNTIESTEMVIPTEDTEKKKDSKNSIENTEMVIPVEKAIPQKSQQKPIEHKKEEKPANKSNQKVSTIDNNVMVIPMDSETALPKNTTGNSTNKPATTNAKENQKPSDKQKQQPVQNNQKAQNPVEKKEQTKKKNLDGPEIYFEDDAKPAEKKKKNPQKQQPLDYDFDDEYYDLGGF